MCIQISKVDKKLPGWVNKNAPVRMTFAWFSWVDLTRKAKLYFKQEGVKKWHEVTQRPLKSFSGSLKHDKRKFGVEERLEWEKEISSVNYPQATVLSLYSVKGAFPWFSYLSSYV